MLRKVVFLIHPLSKGILRVFFAKGRFYKFNLSLANSQNLIKATANVILLSQI